MPKTQKKIYAVDLFAGAGGMSLGAHLSGIEVLMAVENDPHAAETYRCNHSGTKLLEKDIRKVSIADLPEKKSGVSVIFGGPPCQGFSTSNQKTRTKKNPINWLYREFFRVVELWQPDWVIFENVKGIAETENGFFVDQVKSDLQRLNYVAEAAILNASSFGVPQNRSRLFIVANCSKKKFTFPKPSNVSPPALKDVLGDLPQLRNGAFVNELKYPKAAETSYAKMLRRSLTTSTGHLVTKNARYVVERYKHIKQGQNWEAIPRELLKNYEDPGRCHTGIYYRLKWNSPSIVIGNYRKNMLIHPKQNRGLSVREAARIQSFPDSYEFHGSIGFQQQQVGNAVPPLLAKKVFDAIFTAAFSPPYKNDAKT